MRDTKPLSIIIAPGAFKHSLSANAAANAIQRGLIRSEIHATYAVMPVADGGNGTLEAFLTLQQGLTRTEVDVHDPLMRPIKAAFASGRTAVIEMALASGLELLNTSELNVLKATTYGTGELMRAALEMGCREMIIGMGGSATVDGGAGCLQALGVRFIDARGDVIPPGVGGGGLHRITYADFSGMDARWQEVNLLIATDVDNPALGVGGAAEVFAPQKGASRAQVIYLETMLRHFFTLLGRELGVDVRSAPGGGAAGAFAAGLMAVFGDRAQIASGIDLILDRAGFEGQLETCDLVITGEGRMDDQTIHGKGPIGVARRAAAKGVKTVALVGGLQADDTLLRKAGIWTVLPIITEPMTLDVALTRAAELVERAALRLGYLLQL